VSLGAQYVVMRDPTDLCRISVCLALVLMGARKATLGHMLLALHIDPTKAIAGKQHPGAQPCEDGPVSAAWLRDQLAPTYGSLAAAVLRDAERSGTKLLQANAAVINASHPLLAGGAFDDPNHPVRRYAELIRERMGAKLIEARDAKQAEREVDAFASASTQGLIKEMGLELDHDTLLGRCVRVCNGGPNDADLSRQCELCVCVCACVCSAAERDLLQGQLRQQVRQGAHPARRLHSAVWRRRLLRADDAQERKDALRWCVCSLHYGCPCVMSTSRTWFGQPMD
jgi:hypothetical protein